MSKKIESKLVQIMREFRESIDNGTHKKNNVQSSAKMRKNSNKVTKK